MRVLVSRFATDDSGATAIEYGLIAAGIAVRHRDGCWPGRHSAQHAVRHHQDRPYAEAITSLRKRPGRALAGVSPRGPASHFVSPL